MFERVGNGASTSRLRRHVRKLEGERNALHSPKALEKAIRYVADELEGLGLDVDLEPYDFGGKTHVNIVARKWGRSERPDEALPAGRRGGRGRRRPLVRIETGKGGVRVIPGVRVERVGRGAARENGRDADGSGTLRPSLPRIVIGAHIDTVPGTPGADDNASGVAGMLEAARILARDPLDATIEFVGFSLEELQICTYRVGSRHFVKRAKRKRVRYAGALILEMIGYSRDEAGSQRVPRLLRWSGNPRSGNFIAIAGDGRSAPLLDLFQEAAEDAAPGLEVVAQRAPMRGWLVWATRLSDNASFWSKGYPSLMITDTAFLRNPNYHRPTDTRRTLDFDFMAQVTDATVEAARRLATAPSAPGTASGTAPEPAPEPGTVA